jgi:hypothetical protein
LHEDVRRGELLSPLLLNLVVDRLLTVTNDLGFKTFVYADDIIIRVQSKFVHSQGVNAKSPERGSKRKMGYKRGLKIIPHKTAIVPFTNRRILEGLRPLIINGKELKMLNEVKYLGVIFGVETQLEPAFKENNQKDTNHLWLVRRTCGRKWGLRPSMVHWLYTREIRLFIL